MIIFGIFGAIDWDSHQKTDKETGTYTFVHDSGATLFIDGKLVANISEERITRQKSEGNFPYNSIEYCMSLGNIEGKDVDIVYMPHLPCYLYYKQKNDGTLNSIIKKIFPNATFKTVSHHLCHAASSIFTSTINEGSFLTLDGTGSAIIDQSKDIKHSNECFSIGYFNKTKKILRFFPNFSLFNSFGSYHFNLAREIYYDKKKIPYGSCKDETTVSGKIMGLCAYGNYKNSKEWKDYDIEEEYDFPFVSFGSQDNQKNLELSPDDRASILQKNFESALVEYLHILKERSYLDDNICFAGGCFLNVLTNTLIKKSNLFDTVHIPPFTSDTGMSFGAASYAVFLHEKEYEIEIPTNIALMGKIYDNVEIEQELQRYQLNYKKYENFEELCEFTAQELNKNKIVGWFQNSSESGPRALGSRSLLMRPGPAENKDIMNSRVKHREYWRPFAGIILEEHLNDYFEEDFCSPYMLYSFKVKEEKRSEIAAITHADNTCRVQTVTENCHYEIYTLLKEVHKVSGIPIVLNTSFNDSGEPIVETPEDAIKAFINLDIDYLVIGNFIIDKTRNKKFSIKNHLSYE